MSRCITDVTNRNWKAEKAAQQTSEAQADKREAANEVDVVTAIMSSLLINEFGLRVIGA